MIIKVCGMRDDDNIRRLDESGDVDWMGFIFHEKSPRHVHDVPSYLPRHCKRVGVFVNAGTEEIVSRQKVFALDLIQLHGDESCTQCRTLRQALPAGTRIIKMIAVEGEADIAKALAYEEVADYLLFETKSPDFGGSGRKFDWHLLHAYHGTTPFLITGGIGAEDFRDIAGFSHPKFAGIDLNSRFELAPAIKDVDSIRTFARNLANRQA